MNASMMMEINYFMGRAWEIFGKSIVYFRGTCRTLSVGEPPHRPKKKMTGDFRLTYANYAWQ